MSRHDDEPVYYREIQKNAYLKRIPNDSGGSKLLPLGHKKPPLKPMWTQFCVHNGRTPYLEQYPDAESSMTASHKPLWRACLSGTRHVTGSVKPHVGTEHAFLVHTESQSVQMLAPDWDSMQDWVVTLRNKLHELRVMSRGENVYCAGPPVRAPPRAAARDPASPLPPVPPVPPHRVPGIELVTPTSRQPIITQEAVASTTENATEEPIQQTAEETPTNTENIVNTIPENDDSNIDISDWDSTLNLSSLPSTSQVKKDEPKKSVAKICGQNVCLDDSILKRTNAVESDEEFFTEIDRLNYSTENAEAIDVGEKTVKYDEKANCYKNVLKGFKQRVVVSSEGDKAGSSQVETEQSQNSDYQGTNITVIQVSNKGPPHTAIPVMGPETDVFNFDFKQKVTVNPNDKPSDQYVNIVNTETTTQTENGYGTIFSTQKSETEYGHLSLTTTVNLTGTNVDVNNEGIYERLCMASTSNETQSPLPMRRIKLSDKSRKSSLPNLDIDKPSSSESTDYEYLYPNSNSNVATPSNNNKNTTNVNVNVTGNTRVENRNVIKINNHRTEVNSNATVSIENDSHARPSVSTSNVNRNNSSTHNALVNSVSVGGSTNVNLSNRDIRANVERSHSQNSYDSPRLRNRLIRRQNSSPKREEQFDRAEPVQAKPIWKRGLTELSLLSRLRGIGQGKRTESPTRQETNGDRSATSLVKVVHRSRMEARADSTRRRSNSLSNGPPPVALPSLVQRAAATLRAEQSRGAALVAPLPPSHPPLLATHQHALWIAWWGRCGAWYGGRTGDRLAAIRGTRPRDLAHAKTLLKMTPRHKIDILFHRVPLAKIYVLNKEREDESIGIKVDGECTITGIEAGSPAARASLPPPGAWAVTEVNNRPLNLIKGGQDDLNRLSMCGKEVSVLLQPATLVKKIRSVLKANKSHIDMLR